MEKSIQQGTMIKIYFSFTEERKSKKSKYASDIDFEKELYDEDSIQDTELSTGWYCQNMPKICFKGIQDAELTTGLHGWNMPKQYMYFRV